jgi:hypothetical protein
MSVLVINSLRPLADTKHLQVETAIDPAAGPILEGRNFLAVIGPPAPQPAHAPLPTHSERNQAAKTRKGTSLK